MPGRRAVVVRPPHRVPVWWPSGLTACTPATRRRLKARTPTPHGRSRRRAACTPRRLLPPTRPRKPQPPTSTLQTGLQSPPHARRAAYPPRSRQPPPPGRRRRTAHVLSGLSDLGLLCLGGEAK
uniref:Uncharacterized protein n=1 Tax=Oryza glaberrima TaxID=4538 RepID=A0A1V1H062_ORYGL|nr:hypothetical protein [Oryza glaberrima]